MSYLDTCRFLHVLSEQSEASEPAAFLASARPVPIGDLPYPQSQLGFAGRPFRQRHLSTQPELKKSPLPAFPRRSWIPSRRLILSGTRSTIPSQTCQVHLALRLPEPSRQHDELGCLPAAAHRLVAKGVLCSSRGHPLFPERNKATGQADSVQTVLSAIKIAHDSHPRRHSQKTQSRTKSLLREELGRQVSQLGLWGKEDCGDTPLPSLSSQLAQHGPRLQAQIEGLTTSLITSLRPGFPKARSIPRLSEGTLPGCQPWQMHRPPRASSPALPQNGRMP